MKYKIIFTIILFIFSLLLIKSGSYFLKENDNLMKIIKEKQTIYNQEPRNAIITEHTMIPGIRGKKINLDKSYQKMKGINEFKESLLVFDEINPNKTINNIYDKIIVSGNPDINKISIITTLDDKYCYTENLTIKKECINQNKHTLLIYKIDNNHLSKIKDLIKNGIIFFLQFKDNNNLNLIIKYLKNNNYNIVNISELLQE